MSTLLDDALVPSFPASFMATAHGLVMSGLRTQRRVFCPTFTGVSSNEAKTAAPVYIPSDVRER